MKSKIEKRVSYDPEIDQHQGRRDYYKPNSNDFGPTMFNALNNYSSNHNWTREIESIKIVENDIPGEQNQAQTHGNLDMLKYLL